MHKGATGWPPVHSLHQASLAPCQDRSAQISQQKLTAFYLQAQAAPSGEQAWWAGLGALLANVSAYYGQFATAAQVALKDGIAPLEKQLQARI